MTETATPAAPKKRRGFAAMTQEQRRIIASKGGRAAHQKGTAHEWTVAEARTAGQKGGTVSRGGRGRQTGTKRPAGSALGELQEQDAPTF